MRDIVHFGRKSDVVGGSGVMNIAPLVEARRAARSSISRTSLLAKGLALVARNRPEMRQSYLPFPAPHLYQSPKSVATIAVEREWRGEPAVFFDQIEAPEDLSLGEIDTKFRAMQLGPVESLAGFRRLIRFTRMPEPIRRGFWRLGLYGSGYLHSRYFGTFSITTIPAPRTEYMQATTPITMSVIQGFLEPSGDLPLSILVDHRVIDGMALVRIARELESVMNEQVAAELLQGAGLPRSQSRPRPAPSLAKEA
jgi:hypothetical protein